MKNSLQPLATVILTRCFQHCVLNQCLFSLSLFSSLSFYLSLSLPALLLVPMRTRPLNVTARRRTTRRHPNKRPSRERRKPTDLPGRSIWWLVFTPMITKQQSKPNAQMIRYIAVLLEICSQRVSLTVPPPNPKRRAEKAWNTPQGSMNTAFYLLPYMLVSAHENALMFPSVRLFMETRTFLCILQGSI